MPLIDRTIRLTAVCHVGRSDPPQRAKVPKDVSRRVGPRSGKGVAGRKSQLASAVQRILADEGCGSDIYSLGELTIALDAGVDPRKISANGVPKDESLIHRCAREGVRVTIDSEEEVALIEKRRAM